MPWLNQAYRKQPVVAISHLPRRGEQVDPVKKEEHNVKNFVNYCLSKLFWKEDKG